MAVTQYVGARYVPLFADPLDWDSNKSYEPLTIVYHAGNSYTSRQFVPSGVEINNEAYWALTGNYNAQIEQYREEVKRYDARITENTSAITAEVTRATAAEATKAPTNHASEETVYGVGNATNYGHLKLANDDTPMTSGVNDGIAATPKMVEKAIFANRNRKNEHIILIGDSYLLGVHSASNTENGTNWGESFKSVMGCTVETFGNGGSGFWSNGSTAPYAGMNFLAMVNKISSDYSGDKSKVTGIIFESGYNDVTNAVDANNDSIITTVNAARSAFPNARIMVVFAYLPGWNASNASNVGRCYTAYNYAVPQCADVFASALNLNAIVSNISYDNIHPNESAQSHLGKLIAYNYVSGQDYDYESGDVSDPIHIDKNHNLVISAFKHTMKVNVNSTDEPGKEVIFEPSITRSSIGNTKYFYAINPSVSASGEWGSAILALSTDGKLQIQHTNQTFTAGEVIYSVPITVPAFWQYDES